MNCVENHHLHKNTEKKQLRRIFEKFWTQMIFFSLFVDKKQKNFVRVIGKLL